MNASLAHWREEYTWTRLGKVPCLLVAVAYGGTLAALPLLAFQDRNNYLRYAHVSLLLLAKYVLAGVSATLANEPIWLLLNGALGLLLNPESVVRVIIFGSAFLMSYVLLRRGTDRGWGWLILFLFMPQLIENYTIHLTQGCAIAVFLAGWLSISRFRRWLLIGISPFVHSSFFIVLALYFMSGLMKRLRLAEDVQVAATIVVGTVLSIGLIWVASALGARQGAEYQQAGASVSGIGFVFWLAVLVLILAEGRALARTHTLAVMALVFYLATYFFLQFTGRIFESMIALVLLAGLQLTGWRRAAFLALSVAWIGLGWLLEYAKAGFI